MISGRVALGDLTLEFGKARERFEALKSELERLMERQERLMGVERKVLTDLAQTYLPELSPGAVAGGLDALREEMRAALAERAEQRRDLEDRLHRLPDEITSRELLLAEAEGAEEDAAERLEVVRAAVEAELAGDARHAEEVAEHRALMERRSVLTTRKTRLQTTASVERRRYEGDRAFSYLRSRGFGGPEYRAGFLTRRLDGWLARRVHFEELEQKYRVLTEGPGVIQLELRDLTDRARDLERSIDGSERAVGDRHGMPAALAAIASAQDELLDARKALTEVRERYDRLAAELRAIDANKGRPYEVALDRHRAFLDEKSPRELLELARSTVDPRDDRIVNRLRDLRQQINEIGRELEPLRVQLAEQNRATTGVGDLVRKVAAAFTSRRSYFSEEANLGRLVGDVVQGALGPDDAFDALSGAHVKRPLLEADRDPGVRGLFADLSVEFDHELGALEVRHEGPDLDGEVVVYDQFGRVIHRRITPRLLGGG